ncbi:MAG: hypothetical protein ACJA1N_001075 [Saprospiraceae bacterium]|jgi:hypothetical protein|tara:strand:+ start:1455 stop:1814 length:360 start_codon:yes stop_codon:yes gene_type:complete
MTQEIEKCPNCLNTFTLKRLNQKYCSDNCRIQKNNANSRKFRELTKTTNHILLKNRNILAALEGEQISEIDLKIKGFDFRYVTNFRTNEQTKQPDFFCYDYGYFFVKTKKTQLIEIFKL